MLDDTNRRRSGGRPATPTDSRMDRLDWYETDLSGAIHERVLFQDLDMSDSTGTGAQFIDCTFRGAARSLRAGGLVVRELHLRALFAERGLVHGLQVIATDLRLDVRPD